MLQGPSPERGFLSTVGLIPELVVEFQYNPTQLADKRSVMYASLNAPSLLFPVRQYSQGGDRTLTFTIQLDGLFEGPISIDKDEFGSIQPELNKYRLFLYPTLMERGYWQDARGSFTPLYADAQTFSSPPGCVFGFGTDRTINCLVTEVSITETLFNAHLLPVRADVSITLVEVAPYGDEPTPPGVV